MAGQGAIRRKLAAVQQAAAATGGAEKQWPLALARAARDTMALVLETPVLAATRRSLAELLDLAPERALVLVLEGPGEGLGVMMIAPPVLAALIEAQTMGRVQAGAAPPRRATRTDAAMVAGFIDAALAGLEAALAAEDDLIWAGGFRYASFLDDPRPLGLLLEDAPYRVLQAELALGGGAKRGGLLLALPAEGRGERPQGDAGALTEPAAAMAFAAALGAQVMAADCMLEAVLHRVTVPLSAVIGLKPGDMVPLPMAALERIALEGIDGRARGAGKLGQNRGMRAVRLTAEQAAAAVPGRVVPPEPGTAQDGLRLTGT